MKEKPNTPFPANAETIDKSRRESDKELIDMGVELYSVGGPGKDVEDKLKKEKAGEWTNTLGEWIKLHKTIVCPRDFLNDADRDFFDAEKRSFALWFNKVFFVDKEGNIAMFFRPKTSEVGELQNANLTKLEDFDKWTRHKMTELLFVDRQNQIDKRLVDATTRYAKHLAAQEQEKKVKEFDF